MKQTSTADDDATNDNQTAAAVLHNALEDDLNGEWEMDYTNAEREWMHNALDTLAADTETPDQTEDGVLYADDDYVIAADERGTITEYVDELPESSDLLDEEAIDKVNEAHTNAAQEVSGDDLLGSNTDVHVSARTGDTDA